MKTDELLALGRAAGLAAVGVAPAAVLEPARSVLPLRKAAGLAGEMQFTYRNPERSTDPDRTVPGAKSLIAGAWGYGRWLLPEPVASTTNLRASVARYSWHDHYADLEQALQPMADALLAEGFKARVVADTNALVDRNVAWLAGLGWYGKNSNLLLPGQGSWFVLGTVVTDAVLEQTGPPVADGCGSCAQCIEDCPTDAIIAPGVVDATRCLAWIVQAGGVIPREFRVAIGDRLYGCDDCQDVCPPNRSIDRKEESGDGEAASIAPLATEERARVMLQWVLTATDQEILERHGRWYIADRNVDVIRRTALVVLGNIASPTDPEVVPLLQRYLAHPEPLLRAHAVWAARRLGLDILLTEVEPHPMVLAELDSSGSDSREGTDVPPRFTAGDWDR